MFKQLTIAEFQQVRFRLRSMPEFDKLSRNPADVAGFWGDHARFRPERLDQPSGRIRPGSGQNGRTPGIWPDPAVLAESPARTAGFRSTGRDPATLPEFVFAKYKKIFLYYYFLFCE
jgi:hypothetical protein